MHTCWRIKKEYGCERYKSAEDYCWGTVQIKFEQPMRSASIYANVLTLLVCAAACQSARILFMPIGNESHFTEFHGLGRALLARGHEVVVLFGKPDTLPNYAAQAGYDVVTFDTNDTWLVQPDQESHIFGLGSAWKTLIDSSVAKSQSYCTDLFTDSIAFDRLKSINIDVVVVDSLYVVRCYFYYAKKLGIRNMVSFGTSINTWRARLPISTFTEPQVSMVKYFGWLQLYDLHDASLLKRLMNALSSWFLEPGTSEGSKFAYLRQFVKFDLSEQSVDSDISLHLVNRDNAFDWNVYPETPNVKLVGGIGTVPPKPLSGVFERWADDADNGLVLCTFGSMFTVLTADLRKRFFTAFLMMPKLRFIVKTDPSLANETMMEIAAERGDLKVTSNILAASRVPQNDILGHRNTRIFITHSGNNGQFEALANGVPMVAMFIHADQIDNANRVEKRGFGVKLDVFSFTPIELVQALQTILDDYEYYSGRVRKTAEWFHADRHPGERAADAVEKLHKFGPEFFRVPNANELTVVQFYNIDVHLLLSILFASAIVASLIFSVNFMKCLLHHSRFSTRK